MTDANAQSCIIVAGIREGTQDGTDKDREGGQCSNDQHRSARCRAGSALIHFYFLRPADPLFAN
jgi:hypothetical protein